MILNLLNNLFLIKISLLISVFTTTLRFLTLNNVGQNSKIKEKILNLVIKSKLIVKLLIQIKKFTYWFFTENPKNVNKTITILSGLTIGLSFCTRLAITQLIVIPFQSFLLIFFAINGIFRAIITLGILLNKRDLLRKIIENFARKADYEFPTSNFEDKNDQNHQEKEKKFNNNAGTNWGKWGALGSLVGGVGGAVTIYDSIQEKIQNREERQKVAYYKDLMLQEKRRREDLEYLRDNYKEKALIEKERANLENERANLEKERADIEKQRADNLEKKFKEYSKR